MLEHSGEPDGTEPPIPVPPPPTEPLPIPEPPIHIPPHRPGDPPKQMAVQEWDGRRWRVVECLADAGGAEPDPLDPALFPGQYVGQRVVTA